MDNSLYEVSVVIPTFNSQRTIAACIESLLNQTYESFEIIVVDYCSIDATLNIVNSLKKNTTRKIRLLNIRKRGSYAARNKGVVVAEGEIIAFTDSDCIADKNWLKNLLRSFEETNVGEVGGKILSAEPQTTIEKFCELMKVLDQERSLSRDKRSSPPFVLTTNCAMTKNLLREIRGFDESFISGGDLDISQRIRLAGYKIVYQPEAIVYHIHRNTLRGLWQQNFKNGYGISSWRRKMGKKIYIDIWLYADIVYWLSFKLIEYWLRGIRSKENRGLFFIAPFLLAMSNFANLYGRLKYSVKRKVLIL